MKWQLIGYAVACVLVPLAWGLVVVWVSNRIERIVVQRGLKKGKSAEEASIPPIDYHI